MICSVCKGHVDEGIKYVEGWGNNSSPFVFVGPNPTSAKEDLAFVGRGGSLLKDILSEVGVPFEDNYYTYISKCYIKGQPSMVWTRECRDKCFTHELDLIKTPKAIICLGAVPWKALTDNGQASVISDRRKVHYYKGIPLVCTFGLEYILKNPYGREWMVSDLEHYLINEDYKRIPLSFNYAVVDEIEYSPDIVDVETTSLDPRTGELLSIGWRETDHIFVSDRDVKAKTRQAFENVASRINIGANIHFDMQWYLSDREIPNARVHDVQFLHSLLDENYPVRNLKHLFLLYSKYEDYEPSVLPFELERNQLLWYNAADIFATQVVYDGIIEELESIGVNYKPTLNLMSRVQPILAGMEYTGMPVDKDVLEKVRADEKEKVEQLEAVVRALCGDDVNLNSPKQLSNFIFKTLGVKPPKGKAVKNKDGTISTKKSVLERCYDKTGFVDTLLNLKKVRDNYSKYVVNLSTRIDNGRIHPHYRTYQSSFGGTVTGRLSVNNPPIHNIPRGHPMRSAFVPFTPEGYLIQMDLSQIELVGLAYQAQDTELIKAVSTGEDLHTWMATQAKEYGYNITRQDAKTVNYGVLYGITPKGVIDKTKIQNLSIAKDLINMWYDRFYKVREWQEDIEEHAYKYGFVETPYGRRRNFFPFSKNTSEGRSVLRQAKNFPIQAWASDINLLILADTTDIIKEEYPDVFPVTVIHDAIIWAADNDEAMGDWLADFKSYWVEDLLASIKDQLNMDLNVPLTCDIKVGKTWYDSENYGSYRT